jgi:uncharacterized protein YjiS (DUF1127 family)
MSKVLVSELQLSTGRATRLTGWIARLVGGLRRAWQVREASERLATFSDAQLADIGIRRADIERMVRRGR